MKEKIHESYLGVVRETMGDVAPDGASPGVRCCECRNPFVGGDRVSGDPTTGLLRCHDCETTRRANLPSPLSLAPRVVWEWDAEDSGWDKTVSLRPTSHSRACAQEAKTGPSTLRCGCGEPISRSVAHLAIEMGVDLGTVCCTGCSKKSGDIATAYGKREPDATQRANALSDECWRLRDENRELLVENAKLRRAKR